MTTPIDISRATLSTALPPEVSREIWSDMRRESVIQQLCRRVQVPGAGVTVPVIVSDPEAEWVDETDLKPVSRSTFDSKTLRPHTGRELGRTGSARSFLRAADCAVCITSQGGDQPKPQVNEARGYYDASGYRGGSSHGGVSTLVGTNA
jgi:hypothetical protein